VRVWDIPPGRLCRAHLLGEHAELHAIWSIITKRKRGYSNHPETLRWRGKLKALYLRHQTLVKEFRKRGFRHNSVLDRKFAVGDAKQEVFIDTFDRQVRTLRAKKCGCKV